MARPSRTAEANMRTAATRPIEACLLDLLQHFGIERAHIAAGGPPPLKDWHSLATLHPERVASLTLISPPLLDTAPLAGLASRILIVAGDRGALADGAAKFANSLPSVSAHVLRGYEWLPWSDVIADRGAEIGAAMLDFLDRHRLPAVRLSEPEGEVAGITYRIRGGGPPFVLMPLSLAPSQWDPLIATLTARYCTISLGGPLLGVVGILEERGRGTGQDCFGLPGGPTERRCWPRVWRAAECGGSVAQAVCGRGAGRAAGSGAAGQDRQIWGG